jgi:HTH-type transcriptional regulator/antitoxin MqsA
MLVGGLGTLADGKELAVQPYPERCGECGGTMSISAEPIPFDLRGERVIVTDIAHSVCMQCGEMLFDLTSTARLQRAAADQLRASRGLLQSEEIRTLRRSLGLSQAAFERLLGTGPKTVVRWEKGIVFQSATADRLMRVLAQVPGAVEVLMTTPTQSLALSLSASTPS